MEPNNNETINLQEQGVKFNSQDFANKFLNLDEARKSAIKKAVETLNTEYGDDSSNPTFESLFSQEFFEIINPDNAIDEQGKTWRESQIKHLSNLRQELLNAQDEESMNIAATELADHLINL